MKKSKCILLLLLSLFLLSCNKDDDDQPVVVQEYFPTKITTTYASYPNSNAITSIEYDDKNRIAKFKYEKIGRTDSYDIIYDSNNLISLVKFKKVESGTTTTKSLLFTYLNSYLQKLEILSSTELETINFSFNVATGLYSTDRNPYDKFKVDQFNNVIEFEFSAFPSYINYNSNKGVYTNSNSLILLISSCSSYTSGYNFTHFSSMFFSNKEITNVHNGDRIGTVLYDLATTRDSNNTISKVEYITHSSGEAFTTLNFEYELRTIN